MSGPTWQRFQVVSRADPLVFQRDMVVASQDGWKLLDSGADGTHHWAHLVKPDKYKRVATTDRRVGVANRRLYPVDESYGSGDPDKPERRVNGAKQSLRWHTRRLDNSTGKEDQQRIADHYAMVEKWSQGARGPNSGGGE